jgi:hypothetical protein
MQATTKPEVESSMERHVSLKFREKEYPAGDWKEQAPEHTPGALPVCVGEKTNFANNSSDTAKSEQDVTKYNHRYSVAREPSIIDAGERYGAFGFRSRYSLNFVSRDSMSLMVP